MKTPTKAEIREDLYTLRDALKKAGYDPDLILKEYRERYGAREIIQRPRNEQISAKGQAILNKWEEFSPKALGF